MKVVCIRDDWDQSGNHPKIDNIYEVTRSEIDNGKLFYSLKGFEPYSYNAIGVVPLDEYLNQFTESLTKELTEVEQLELV